MPGYAPALFCARFAMHLSSTPTRWMFLSINDWRVSNLDNAYARVYFGILLAVLGLRESSTSPQWWHSIYKRKLLASDQDGMLKQVTSKL